MQPPSSGNRLNADLNSLLSRQSSEWKSGHRIRPEDLTVQISDEPTRRDVLLELIHNEVILREEIGELPTLAEYQCRYPSLADELQIQWTLDLAILGETHGFDPDSIRPDVRRIDRYELREIVGHGAMGVVYKAWDPQLKRIVALKRLRSGIDASPQEKSRLKSEAEAIARLSHENVVRIYDHGEIGDMPWLAMEYCEHGSLADFLNGVPTAPHEAAQLVLQIASGVTAAHDSQIIHRDLKPSNILLVPRATQEMTGSGTVTSQPSQTTSMTSGAKRLRLASVVPRVTDFGLARLLDEDAMHTKTGMLLGTPAYMSPEQAAGRKSDVGTSSDVYSLGCILYECLTGRPPLRAESVAETLRQVAEVDPVAPALLNPSVPADLNNIVMKTLEKHPSQRYRSMRSFADDLSRFLDGRPVLARPLPGFVRLWRWCRRSPVYATSSAIVLMAIIVMIFLREAYVREVTTSRNQEIESRRKAERLQREAEDNAIAARASASRALTSEAEALRQLERAEQNSVWAMEAVDSLLQRATDQSLSSIPGMMRVREQLLNEALKQCERFLQDRGNSDPAARFTTGIVLQRTGRIHRQIQQFETSEAELREAVQTFSVLTEQDPKNPQYAAELAKSQYQLSLTLPKTQGASNASQMKRDSLATLNAALARFPDHAELLRGKVNVLTSIGPDLRREGKPGDAEQAYREAEAILSQLHQKSPDDLRLLNTSRLLYGNHATLLRTTGRSEEALELQRTVVTAADRIAELSSGDSAAAQARVSALYGLASIRLTLPGMQSEAVKEYQIAAQLSEKLAVDEPLVQEYIVQAANVWMALGIAHESVGDLNAALQAAEHSLKWQKSLAERNLQDDVVQLEYGRILGFTSMLLFQVRQLERAQQLSQESLNVLQRFGDVSKGPDAVTAWLMSAYARLKIEPQLFSASPLGHEALKLARDALQKFPAHRELRNAVSLVIGVCWHDEVRANHGEASLALADEGLATTDPADKSYWMVRRAVSQALAGDYRAAFSTADSAGLLPSHQTYQPSEILLALSVCAQKSSADMSVAEGQRAEFAEKCHQRAREILAGQIDAGSYQFGPHREILLNDDRLKMFRELPDVRTLLSPLAQEAAVGPAEASPPVPKSGV
ncbi:MAG: protein kinase [Planctomycetaceae bacterium]